MMRLISAETTKIPEPIIDLIEQHHGTTLVEPFFHEARKKYETILAAVPDHVDAMVNLGNLLYLSGSENAAATCYDYLRATWQREVQPVAGAAAATFEQFWEDALKNGGVLVGAAGAAPAAGGGAAAPALNAAGLARLKLQPATFDGGQGSDQLVLLAYPSYRFYDGRTADRPWLQELPDPVNKVTIVDAPPTTPPQPPLGSALQLDHRFSPGWRFACYNPPENMAAIEGQPKAVGMWIYGEGSGDVLPVAGL